MALQPLPTQTQDADFLVNNVHPALFSEPGTGKTITALEGYKRAQGRLLVLAPPIALRMWAHNIDQHLGARAQIIKSGSDKIDWTADAHILSYPLACKHPQLTGADVLVLDESDALKTLGSQRTKAVYGDRANRKHCLAAGVQHVWPLTGTPIRRYADDLYPQLKALHGDKLRQDLGITSYQGFLDKFCVAQLRRFYARQQAKATVIANKNEELLRDFIYGNNLAVRRTIHDVAAHMPPLTVRDVTVQFDNTPELREATGEAIDAGETEAVMATARRLLGVAKAKHIAAYALETWEALSVPLLMFYWHKEVGDILEAAFKAKGLNVGRIDGSTSQAKRAQLEADFNDHKIDVLLGQIASMGVAINLQRGSHYGIFAEMDWSPAAKDQALRRLWRLGQDVHVQIDICSAEHPIDEAVASVTSRKEISAERIVG
jgi:SNF2 family DNA or RNA helicase